MKRSAIKMPKHDLKLGIVTISYNQAQFLPEAIKSVTIKDPGLLRYVIVDPGSTDTSREIILANRERFSAIVFEKDSGPADGLNKGFDACDADIYGYLNADDYLLPGALDWVLRFFSTHEDVDAILGPIVMVDGSGKEQFRRRVPWKFGLEGMLNDTALYLQQSCFFRKKAWQLVSGFNAQNKTCWDTELAVDMMLAGVKFHRILRPLGAFRVYPTSITGQIASAGSSFALRSHEEHQRIKNKIIASGFQGTLATATGSQKLLDRINPVRRFWEILAR